MPPGVLYTMSCTYGFLELSKEDSRVDKYIGPLPDSLAKINIWNGDKAPADTEFCNTLPRSMQMCEDCRVDTIHPAVLRMLRMSVRGHLVPVHWTPEAQREIVMYCDLCSYSTRGIRRERLKKRLEINMNTCKAIIMQAGYTSSEAESGQLESNICDNCSEKINRGRNHLQSASLVAVPNILSQ